jgi:hypothetical protein
MPESNSFMTLDALIGMLERRRAKVGGNTTVAIAGFDPGNIGLSDNYNPNLYPEVKTLLEVE